MKPDTAEIHKKIHEAFERAREAGTTKVKRPSKSLAEKSERLVERLKNDPFIFLSSHGEVHHVRVPAKLSTSSGPLDLRCKDLYVKAVRALRKEKQAGRPAP